MNTETIDVTMKGWALAFVGGATMIGQLHRTALTGSLDGGTPIKVETERVLSPVFELQVHIQQDPRTRKNRVTHQATPVAFLLSIASLTLPPGIVTVPCEELDQGDREALVQAVHAAEEIVMGLRAAKAGVSLIQRGYIPGLSGRDG